MVWPLTSVSGGCPCELLTCVCLTTVSWYMAAEQVIRVPSILQSFTTWSKTQSPFCVRRQLINHKTDSQGSVWTQISALWASHHTVQHKWFSNSERHECKVLWKKTVESNNFEELLFTMLLMLQVRTHTHPHSLQASPWLTQDHVTLQVVAFLSKDKGLHHFVWTCTMWPYKSVTAFLLSAIRMVSSILQSSRNAAPCGGSSPPTLTDSDYETKRRFHATQQSVAGGVPLHCATTEYFSAVSRWLMVTFSAEATEWKPAAMAKNICSYWQSWK